MIASLAMKPDYNRLRFREFRLYTCGRRLLEAVYDELQRSLIPPGTYELILSETFGDEDLPEELACRPDVVWVDQVSAFPAGQGTGRRVMGILLEAADREGVAVALVPTAFMAEGCMAYGPLVDWYERLGFVSAFEDSIWVREPRL